MEDIYMIEALKQAKKAEKNGDIPVGAVIVKNGKIIARAYNKREKTKNVLNHAEMIAIKKACINSNDWRLNDCLLFVTLKPCMMCLGAAIQARIKKIIYAAENANGDTSNLKIEIKKTKNNIFEEESSLLLKNFFQNKRK